MPVNWKAYETWLQGHRESMETVMAGKCGSCSLMASVSWTSFVTHFCISFFLPQRRMYKPMITITDPNKLLNVKCSTNEES